VSDAYTVPILGVTFKPAFLLKYNSCSYALLQINSSQLEASCHYPHTFKTILSSPFILLHVPALPQPAEEASTSTLACYSACLSFHFPLQYQFSQCSLLFLDYLEDGEVSLF